MEIKPEWYCWVEDGDVRSEDPYDVLDAVGGDPGRPVEIVGCVMVSRGFYVLPPPGSGETDPFGPFATAAEAKAAYDAAVAELEAEG